uniref:Uncharacterized protein n=1 Tax=Romanomermis culicivorax TaxID=13658 RepID=A0A915IFJ7_ROMCU
MQCQDHLQSAGHVKGVNHDDVDIKNGVDIEIHQEISSNNTLIIAIIVKDDTFDHVFSEGGFHINKDGTVGGCKIVDLANRGPDVARIICSMGYCCLWDDPGADNRHNHDDSGIGILGACGPSLQLAALKRFQFAAAVAEKRHFWVAPAMVQLYGGLWVGPSPSGGLVTGRCYIDSQISEMNKEGQEAFVGDSTINYKQMHIIDNCLDSAIFFAVWCCVCSSSVADGPALLVAVVPKTCPRADGTAVVVGRVAIEVC